MLDMSHGGRNIEREHMVATVVIRYRKDGVCWHYPESIVCNQEIFDRRCVPYNERRVQRYVNALWNEGRMQLRDHPKMIGRWPPRRPVDGPYRGMRPRITIEQLSETAVMQRVADCPPLPPPTGAQGIVLYTDQGPGLIVAPDASFREHLFQTFQTCLGLSVQELGDIEIDF